MCETKVVMCETKVIMCETKVIMCETKVVFKTKLFYSRLPVARIPQIATRRRHTPGCICLVSTQAPYVSFPTNQRIVNYFCYCLDHVAFLI